MANKKEVRQKVFCGSLCDFLDPEVPIEWLADLLTIIENTRHLDWLLLTKRIELFHDRISEATGFSDGDMWLHGNDHVWLGVSVENRVRADLRIPELMRIEAKVKFISCEPLLQSIDVSKYLYQGLNWVIAGGESGSDRRAFNLNWFSSLAKQCEFFGVPFFMKQLDKIQPIPGDLMIREFPV
jgi:protein gp37